jgi:two-component system response regulator FixJ
MGTPPGGLMTGDRQHVVAIVEDDPGVREALRFLLETAGYAVETYESGVHFLAEARPARLACLVLDQDMPRLAGLDLFAELYLAPPTLLIVSTPSRAVARRAAELGVRRLLEKPLAETDLLAEIAAIVR